MGIMGTRLDHSRRPHRRRPRALRLPGRGPAWVLADRAARHRRLHRRRPGRQIFWRKQSGNFTFRRLAHVDPRRGAPHLGVDHVRAVTGAAGATAGRRAAPMTPLADLEAASRSVYAVMPPTPQYAWPLLARAPAARSGSSTRTTRRPAPSRCAAAQHARCAPSAATRSCPAWSARRAATTARASRRRAPPRRATVIVVPHGNSREKNAAMRALGAELIEHGRDFDEAKEHAGALAREQGLDSVGPFHPELVAGVGSYALELFRAVRGPRRGLRADRLRLRHLRADRRARRARAEDEDRRRGLRPAPTCYARSFGKRAPVETASADTFADGMAVRVPGRRRRWRSSAPARSGSSGSSDDEVEGGGPAYLQRHAQARRGRRRSAAGGAARPGAQGRALRGDQPLRRQHRPRRLRRIIAG